MTNIDKKRTKRLLEVGDFVFVRIIPYNQRSLKIIGVEKFKPRFYGPYIIKCKVGEVAYELEPPPHNKMYSVFYVYYLEKFQISSSSLT